MLAAVIHGAYDIRMQEVADPAIQSPADAIVRVTQACICGSDLWAYQGVAKRNPGQRIGHEFVGVVEETGKDVRRGSSPWAAMSHAPGLPKPSEPQT